MIRNEAFLQIAQSIPVQLNHKTVTLKGEARPLEKGEEVVFDFGTHYVGTLDISFGYEGNHPDAPLYFSIKFCETKKELDEDEDNYHGWVSASWIQREFVHVDVIPSVVSLSRRYAFRYVKIKILEASSNYRATIKELTATAVSSACDENIAPFVGSKQDEKMDQVSILTLHECMQLVFEDGPKRDRRLWLGDLRLQALANYQTYRQNDLVKRCLYLFAGVTLDNGQVASNLFLEPQIECDFQSMFDYSLFFINTLWNYYEETGDKQTLNDLAPCAYRQYELAKEQFDGDVCRDSDKLGWCFIDWSLQLNKQASAQAVYLYAANDLVKIQKALEKDTKALERDILAKRQAARDVFFKDGVFVSGKDEQVSLASQVWMILAGVVTGDEAKEVLARAEERKDLIKPVTPYMMHHYVQSLVDIGETKKAYEVMHAYWGKMIEDGADTFYELFDPEHPDVSPYGGNVVNSYCHAWSCTPTYFLRKNFFNS